MSATPTPPTARTAANNPYIGASPFPFGRVLYGRDSESQELLNRLIAQRIVLLHSPSGAGKTSLIRAALAPALEQEEFTVLPIARVNAEPPGGDWGETHNRYVYSVLQWLESWLEDGERPAHGRPARGRVPLATLAQQTLGDYLRARPNAATLRVLILDQFEEILTVDPTDIDAKLEFFKQLGAALADRQLWALFSMREDYLAALMPYAEPLPTRLATTFRLDLLRGDAAVAAVVGPAAERHVTFEDAGARLLVNDLCRTKVQHLSGKIEERDGKYVEPVQLQVVCQCLWEQPAADPARITKADVQKLGSSKDGKQKLGTVDEALADYYEQKIAEAAKAADTTGASEAAIRAWFGEQLILEQGTRGHVPKGERSSAGLDNRVIRSLVAGALVREQQHGTTWWYELTHDRLIAPIHRSNAEYLRREQARAAQARSRLVQRWIFTVVAVGLLLGAALATLLLVVLPEREVEQKKQVEDLQRQIVAEKEVVKKELSQQDVDRARWAAWAGELTRAAEEPGTPALARCEAVLARFDRRGDGTSGRPSGERRRELCPGDAATGSACATIEQAEAALDRATRQMMRELLPAAQQRQRPRQTTFAWAETASTPLEVAQVPEGEGTNLYLRPCARHDSNSEWLTMAGVERIAGAISAVGIDSKGTLVAALGGQLSLFHVNAPGPQSYHYDLAPIGPPIATELGAGDVLDPSFVLAPLLIENVAMLLAGTNDRGFTLHVLGDGARPRTLAPVHLGAGPVVAGVVTDAEVYLLHTGPSDADATQRSLDRRGDDLAVLCSLAGRSGPGEGRFFRNEPATQAPTVREQPQVVVNVGYLPQGPNGDLIRTEWEKIRSRAAYERAMRAGQPLLSNNSKSFWSSCDKIDGNGKNLGGPTLGISKLAVVRLGWLQPKSLVPSCKNAWGFLFARGTWRWVPEDAEGSCVGKVTAAAPPAAARP